MSPTPLASTILFGAARTNPTLTANTKANQAFLDELAQKADQVTDWTWNAGVGKLTLAGKLDGKPFAISQEHTSDDFTRTKPNTTETHRYNFMNNEVITPGDAAAPKSTLILKKAFDKLFGKLTKVAFPKIEKDLGLGKELDVSNLVAKLAKDTAEGTLKWAPSTPPADNLDDLFAQVLSPKGGLSATDAEGTKFTFSQEAILLGLGGFSSFIAVEKPGLPRQNISISSKGQEGKALQLITTVFETLNNAEQAKAEIAKRQAEITEFQGVIDATPADLKGLAAAADDFLNPDKNKGEGI